MTAKDFLEVSKGVRGELDELLETHAEIEQALRGGGGAVDGEGGEEEDQALLDELAGLGEDNTVSASSIVGAAAVGAVAVGAVAVGAAAVGAAESVAVKEVGKAVGTTVAVRAVSGQMGGEAEGQMEGKAVGEAEGQAAGEAVEKTLKEEGGGKAMVPLLASSSVAVEAEPAVVASVNGESEERAETTEEKDTKIVAGKRATQKEKQREKQKEKQKEKRVLVAS
jgi:hypothetical protein